MGGSYNEYIGDHFGEIIWAEFAQDLEKELKERPRINAMSNVLTIWELLNAFPHLSKFCAKTQSKTFSC